MPKINWVIAVLALAVALIYGSHHFFMPQFLDEGWSYYPLTIDSYSDVAMFYGPRANAVYHGGLRIGDFYLAEYGDGPAMLPMLNPVLLGWLSRAFGSLKNGIMVSDFLFPPLIFLALYFLAKEITGENFFSIFFASVFIFAPKLFLYIPPLSFGAIKEFLRNFIPILAPPESLYFERIEYPKITFLFYALAFYFALRALKRKEKSSVYFAGGGFGILFYTYLYDWAYFLAGLAIMFVIFSALRKYEEAKITAKIAGIGFLISVFYWINFFQLNSLPQYGDVFARIGAEISHNFRWASVWKSYLRNAVLIGFMWILWKKSFQETAIYISSFLLAYFAVVNAQIILGFNPHPDHWYRVEFLPIGLAVLWIVCGIYEKYLKFISLRAFNTVSAAFIIIFFGQVFYSQYIFSRTNAKAFSLPDYKLSVYAWLNKNTPEGSVVGALSPSENIEISLYTHNKVFLPGGGNSLAPTAEIWDRFLIAAGIFGVRPERLGPIAKEGSLYYFHDFYRDKSFDTYFKERSGEIPEYELEEKTQIYSAGYADMKAFKIPYKLDYLYFDTAGAGVFAPGKDPAKLIPGLLKVYDGQIRIYKISRL